MNAVPQLVFDRDTGKICIMIKIGGEIAVQELPDHLATATEVELRSYMEGAIPDMLAGLHDTIRDKRRTIWKKAKHAESALPSASASDRKEPRVDAEGCDLGPAE